MLGNADAFVAKIDTTQSGAASLIYSTYLGGSGTDIGLGIRVDSSGNAFVSGETASANFPTTPGVVETNNPCRALFVSKLNASGLALVYSTYVGGGSCAGADVGEHTLALDSSGNAYVTGLAAGDAPGLPMVCAVQPVFGGSIDAIVAKLNATGTAYLFSTFLGGSGGEVGYGIAVDSGGNMYVTGLADSGGFPAVNAAQSGYGGGYSDAIVAKISASPPCGSCSLVFTGFLAPISGADATGGSFASPLRTFKMNSTIPVKFSATCNGSPAVTGIHTLQVIKYSDATTPGTPIDATPSDAATTGDQFRLTGTDWHFNLDTRATGMSKGIWLFVATLSDGSQHTAWIQIK